MLFRFWWRRRTPLPPWDPSLTAAERIVAHWTERILLGSVAAIAASGPLVLAEDDLLVVHVTAHLVFFSALTVHLGLVPQFQSVVDDVEDQLGDPVAVGLRLHDARLLLVDPRLV